MLATKSNSQTLCRLYSVSSVQLSTSGLRIYEGTLWMESAGRPYWQVERREGRGRTLFSGRWLSPLFLVANSQSFFSSRLK